MCCAVNPAFAISTLKAATAHEWTFVSASLPALQEQECGGWLAGGVPLVLSVELISIFFNSTSWNTGQSLTTVSCPFMILFVVMKHWDHVLDRFLLSTALVSVLPEGVKPQNQHWAWCGFTDPVPDLVPVYLEWGKDVVKRLWKGKGCMAEGRYPLRVAVIADFFCAWQ